MMKHERLCVLYILHDGEAGAPALLREAAHVISIREGGIPDLSSFDDPPQAIVATPPLDDEMLRALARLETLDLPFVGLGTGKVGRFDAYVTADIPPEDLAAILELVCERAEILHLNGSEFDHPVAARCLNVLTDSVTRMIEHLMTLRIPEYPARTDRVTQTCHWIGTHLGISEAELNSLLHAARLRELGKLGLPDGILFAQRADRTAVEQRLYDRYPALGAHAISELPSLKDAARIIEYHLENYDGSGPAGLVSHQIPLGSRILRVAGAYEMIFSNAPSGITSEEIMSILESGQGSKYDPLLVKLVQNYHALTSAARTEGRRTRSIRLADIIEGMVLAEDIWSRSGMKIVPRGTRVTPSILNLLQGSTLDSALDAVEVLSGSSQPEGGLV